LQEELSYGKDRNLDKGHIQQLADCSFIDRAENILISGATGAGKSFLGLCSGASGLCNRLQSPIP
jgi:DNA replication protein DnaC